MRQRRRRRGPPVLAAMSACFRGSGRSTGRCLSRDVVAGITLAALAIPEVMGYTKIAGTPVITGLYTILLPAVAFAVLGSSRHLVVGGDSATAAIMYAGIAGLGISGPPAADRRVARVREPRSADHGRPADARARREARLPGRLHLAHRARRLPHGRRDPGRARASSPGCSASRPPRSASTRSAAP